jgi:hypothetical protein
MSGTITRRFNFGSMSGATFFIDVRNDTVRGVVCDNPGPGTIHAEAVFDPPIGTVGRDFPPNPPGQPTTVAVPPNQVAVTMDAENEPVFAPPLRNFRAWTV